MGVYIVGIMLEGMRKLGMLMLMLMLMVLLVLMNLILDDRRVVRVRMSVRVLVIDVGLARMRKVRGEELHRRNGCVCECGCVDEMCDVDDKRIKHNNNNAWAKTLQPNRTTSSMVKTRLRNCPLHFVLRQC